MVIGVFGIDGTLNLVLPLAALELLSNGVLRVWLQLPSLAGKLRAVTFPRGAHRALAKHHAIMQSWRTAAMMFVELDCFG